MTNETNRPKHIKLFIGVLILSIAFSAFTIMQAGKLNDSALLYMGIPIIIALSVALIETKQRIMSKTMKYVTLALLLSGPLLREGFICIIMAAPIFYAVAAIIASIAQHVADKNNGGDGNTLQANLLITLLVMMSLEGTHPTLTFDRNNTIDVTRTIAMPIEQVKAQLAQAPRFEQSLPLFLRIFPKPVASSGHGLAVGDTRTLDFEYHKWLFFNTHKGRMVSEIADVSPNSVNFKVMSDSSYLSNYLTWQGFNVSYEAIDAHSTKITWSVQYSRKLDPVWYFGPMQRYAAWLTANSFIDNLTPTGASL